MHNLVKYFKDFIRDHYEWRLYLFTAIFLNFSIWLNFSYNIEREFIGYHSWYSVLGFFILQALPFYIIALLQSFLKSDYSIFSKPTFWYLTTIGFLILAFSRGFPYSLDFVEMFPNEVVIFIDRCFGKGKRLFTIILPLFLLYRLTRERFGYIDFYGLSVKKINATPYLVLLLSLAPLVYIASFNTGFLKTYPTYRGDNAHLFLEVSEYATVAVYELFYATGFIAIELFFRGFLVIGLAFLLGKDAILPMTASYVFLHFGKPSGEAVASMFAGYGLGIIALYSKNIWGGVLIHVGTAWLMEFMTWLQRTEQNVY